MSAFAARRPLDGWSVDQLWSSLATVSIQSTTSSVSCVSPLHGGASPPLSVLFASRDAEDFGDEIVGERLPVVLHQP